MQDVRGALPALTPASPRHALSPSAILARAGQSSEQIAGSLAELYPRLYPRLSAAYPVLTSTALPSPPRQSGAELTSGGISHGEVTSGAISPGAADDEVTPHEVAEAVDEIAGEISAQIAELDPDAQLAVVLQACARLGAQQREAVGSALLASRGEG